MIFLNFLLIPTTISIKQFFVSLKDVFYARKRFRWSAVAIFPQESDMELPLSELCKRWSDTLQKRFGENAEL